LITPQDLRALSFFIWQLSWWPNGHELLKSENDASTRRRKIQDRSTNHDPNFQIRDLSMQIRSIFALVTSTICLFGCESTLNESAAAERGRFIESFAARYREEACGTHWVGNPSFADCMAALRREAESHYQSAFERGRFRWGAGTSSKP
jgi:hypothetical protein